MTGKYHLLAASSTGLAASVIYFLNKDPSIITFLEAGGLFVTASIAGLMPDVDLPKATAGKAFKPIALFINKVFGHRTITHTGLWFIPLIILLFKTNWSFYLIGTTIGFLSHILSDTMTAGGIPWVYPLSKKRLALTRAMSGHHDFFLTIMASGIIIGCLVFYHLYKNNLLQF